jgi:hypothetical protein
MVWGLAVGWVEHCSTQHTQAKVYIISKTTEMSFQLLSHSKNQSLKPKTQSLKPKA